MAREARISYTAAASQMLLVILLMTFNSNSSPRLS